MKRPWSGQVEKANEEERPEFDPKVSKYLVFITINKNLSVISDSNDIYLMSVENCKCLN